MLSPQKQICNNIADCSVILSTPNEDIMSIPQIACYSCNKRLSRSINGVDVFELYQRQGMTRKEALNAMGLTRYCCRTAVLSDIKLSNPTQTCDPVMSAELAGLYIEPGLSDDLSAPATPITSLSSLLTPKKISTATVPKLTTSVKPTILTGTTIPTKQPATQVLPTFLSPKKTGVTLSIKPTIVQPTKEVKTVQPVQQETKVIQPVMLPTQQAPLTAQQETKGPQTQLIPQQEMKGPQSVQTSSQFAGRKFKTYLSR